jgi:hypothetical protein
MASETPDRPGIAEELHVEVVVGVRNELKEERFAQSIDRRWMERKE